MCFSHSHPGSSTTSASTILTRSSNGHVKHHLSMRVAPVPWLPLYNSAPASFKPPSLLFLAKDPLWLQPCPACAVLISLVLDSWDPCEGLPKVCGQPHVCTPLGSQHQSGMGSSRTQKLGGPRAIRKLQACGKGKLRRTTFVKKRHPNTTVRPPSSAIHQYNTLRCSPFSHTSQPRDYRSNTKSIVFSYSVD